MDDVQEKRKSVTILFLASKIAKFYNTGIMTTMLALCCIFSVRRQGLSSIERGLLFHYLVVRAFGDASGLDNGQQFPRFFIWLNLKIMPIPEGTGGAKKEYEK